MLSSILYKIYFFIKRFERQHYTSSIKNLALNINYRIEDFFNKYIVEYYRTNKKNVSLTTRKKNDKKIVVSLTSFPKRIDTVWITIETIMNQSMKPDEIILWLAKEQFDGLNSLPVELLNQQKRGLTINFCEDLRSHKKYYFTLKEYPNDIVILFDDDMFYPRDTIKKLYKLHKSNPQDICVITTQVITPNIYSNPSKWRNPHINEKIKHSSKVQIFSGSGTLLTYNFLDQQVFDKSLIKELCPYADDLWLTFMSYKKGTKISSLRKWRAFPITIYGTSENSLWYINAEGGENDKQWKKLQEAFKNDFKKIEVEYNAESNKEN